MSCDLAGIGVLVTRPSRQAKPLCDLIAAKGGTPVPFPTIAISGPEDPDGVTERLRKIAKFDLLVFVSPNAVRYTFSFLENRPLPKGSRVAVVGKGTDRALREFGRYADLLPEERFDSEGLLAMPQLQHMADRTVLILRGNGGRPLLGDTLMLRGARVEYAEVYTRNKVTADAAPLVSAWSQQIQIATATSCEILENLFHLLGEPGRPLLCQTPLVVVSERIKTRARELGCNNIILADEASDQGLIRSICNWVEQGRASQV